MDSHKPNILFLGGAKRVSMARMMKASAASIGHPAEIFSYEMDTCVPIACEATVIIGLRWDDPAIYSHLDEVVERHRIGIVVPFVDGAVAVAAEYAQRSGGKVFVPTASAELASAMLDKVESAKRFEKACLPIPATYHPGEPCMRLIAKPRYGSASKGIIEINNLDSLDSILLRGDEYLIQERIDHRRELTIDCYASVTDGRLLAVSPRLRIATVGGEVTDTVTIDCDDAKQIASKLITALALRGAITVQLIDDLDRPTDSLLVMEVNPRLGGGAVCSVIAGADIPRLILEEAYGMTAAPVEARAGVRICRYMQEVTFIDDKLSK